MTFLNTALLGAGLGAIVIPIVIHLLMRRRRKPVMWAAMRFLEEAYRRTRRRLLIERWLLLAVRCLLLAALAVAIGRPVIGALASGRVGGRTVYLLIDNALGAGLKREGGGAALDGHLETARRLIGDLGDGDRVAIISLAGPARGDLLPPTPSVSGAGTLLTGITARSSQADLRGALALATESISTLRASSDLLAPIDRTHIVLISDLLAGAVDVETTLPKLPAGVRLSVAEPRSPATAQSNVSIISVAPLRPVIVAGSAGAGQPSQAQPVTVQLQRSGPGAAAPGETRLSARLMLEGRAPATPASVVVRWAAGQREATATLAVEGPATGADGLGTAVLTARIEGDALAGDDTARTPVEIREALRLAIIGAPSDGRGSGGGADTLRGAEWIRLALRPREDSTIDLIELEQDALDAGRLAGLDGVLICTPERLTEGDWTKLRTLSDGRTGGGVVLLVCPPGDATVHTWTDAMTRGLKLPWQIGREARTYLPLDEARPRLASAAALGATGGLDLLGALRGELDELVRPVNVWRLLAIEPRDPGTHTVLGLTDGQPLIVMTDLGSTPKATEPEGPASSPGTSGSRAVVVFMTTALDLRWTDLPAKPLMVPLMQELVRQGIGRARGGTGAIAGARVATPGQSIRLVPWTTGSEDEGAEPLAVGEYGLTSEAIRSAGVWNAVDASGGRRGVVVVNPDARGGRIDPVDRGALSALLTASAGAPVTWFIAEGAREGPGAGGAGAVTTILTSGTSGRPTGPWMLAGVCLFALLELGLARRFSHATISRGGE